MKRVLLLNGANLNFLGKRDKAIYGSLDFATLISQLEAHAKCLGLDLECFQSNHEGVLIDLLQQKADYIDGLVINPGAFTHYSYALSDCLADITVPIIEVHISNIHNREQFRHQSLTARHCWGQIVGLGTMGYFLALDALVKRGEGG